MQVISIKLKLNRQEIDQLEKDLKVIECKSPGAIVTSLVARLEQDAEAHEMVKTLSSNPLMAKIMLNIGQEIPKDLKELWEAKKARYKAAIAECLNVIQ